VHFFRDTAAKMPKSIMKETWASRKAFLTHLSHLLEIQ
jgi:hypothetical protein